MNDEPMRSLRRHHELAIMNAFRAAMMDGFEVDLLGYVSSLRNVPNVRVRESDVRPTNVHYDRVPRSSRGGRYV